MFIEGLNENQDEIWENSAKATRRESVIGMYSVGVDVDKISKGLKLSTEEVLQIINLSKKEK